VFTAEIGPEQLEVLATALEHAVGALPAAATVP
jgi:hypothetical protein